MTKSTADQLSLETSSDMSVHKQLLLQIAEECNYFYMATLK